ncbi:uncharacterized protein LOC113326027 [Papaver somniferum]|uniref:uncharacterized protein LOC113326027 n=1 Tax=Papaver somniferum TaxID=3469 RepID=UPI000E6FF57F|nr:uncharacterized protein LOC113326027 [Papaver somniferum]
MDWYIDALTNLNSILLANIDERRRLNKKIKVLILDISSNIAAAIEEEERIYLEDSFDIFAEKDETVRTRFRNPESFEIRDFFTIFSEEFQEIELPVLKPQSDEPYILCFASIDETKFYFFLAFKCSKYAGRIHGRVVALPWSIITFSVSQVARDQTFCTWLM